MKSLALVVAFALTGCPSADVDSGEGVGGPTVEFDPANRIIPFPNDLVRTGPGGTVAVPEPCNETPAAKAIREGVLNKLDGFGTYQAVMQVTFSEAVDPASLAGKIVVVKRASSGVAVDPAMAQPIPEQALIVSVGETTRVGPDCAAAPQTVNSVTIVSATPLEGNATYVVALREGVKTAGGEAFAASFTWELVRQAQSPVVVDSMGNVVVDRTPLDPNVPAQLEQLRGISLLWNAHAQALGFLDAIGVPRGTTLIAWELTTQTTTAPLDREVEGSPASEIDTAPLGAGQSIVAVAANRTPPSPFAQCVAGDSNTQCFMKIALGRGDYAAGDAACTQVGCAALGDVQATLLSAKQYQLDVANTGYTGAGARPIPGAWGDPRTPAMVRSEDVQVFVSRPAAAPPAAGYPVVIFQHGLTRAKTDMIAIISQLAAQGFAVVAIDAVAHGSRAVRVSSDAARGCANAAPGLFGPRADSGPDPTDPTKVGCYAPFLSPDLAATRDNIRQTVIDHQRLAVAVAGSASFDATKIFYVGQSLGGIIGGMTVGLAPVKGAVLNVPAVGWADILENTASLGIACSLVDGLIDAGILVGDKFDPLAGTGLCTTPAWKAQPGYRQFAVIGRWVLDPADPANFVGRTGQKRLLIQEVAGDAVVPNVATDRQGALLGLAPLAAAPFPPTTPSPAITSDPTASKLLLYTNLPPDAGTGFPGNAYAHGSLLAPATATADGGAGTGRMQTDAVTFLVLNLIP